MSSRGGDGPYVRAVEAAWSKLRGRPTVLSPRDFETVSGWRRRGIPLSVVLEVFDHRAKRRGAGGGWSLAYLASEIESAWETVASGRSVAAAPAASEERPSRWCEAALRQPEGSELRALVEGLAAQGEAGAAAAELEDRLDVALLRIAPPALILEAEAETSKALAAYRTRMPPDELRRTQARGVNDRLRRLLSLPPRLR